MHNTQPEPGKFLDDAASLIESLSVYLQDEGNRHQAMLKVEAQATDIRTTLEWTQAAGDLSEIQIEEHLNTGLKRAVPGGPVELGFGNAPRDVLAMSIEKTVLRPGVSEGFVLSKEDTIYVWSTMDNGQLKYLPVTGAGSQQLSHQALLLHSDATVLQGIKDAQRDRVYNAAVERIGKQAKDLETAAKVARINEARQAAARRLQEIAADLQAKLRAADSANASYQALKALAGVVSLGQLIAQASSLSHGALDAKLRQAATTDDVLRITDDYVGGQQAAAKQQQDLKAGQETELKGIQQQMDSELLRDGAPAIVIPPRL